MSSCEHTPFLPAVQSVLLHPHVEAQWLSLRQYMHTRARTHPIKQQSPRVSTHGRRHPPGQRSWGEELQAEIAAGPRRLALLLLLLLWWAGAAALQLPACLQTAAAAHPAAAAAWQQAAAQQQLSDAHSTAAHAAYAHYVQAGTSRYALKQLLVVVYHMPCST